MRMFRQSTHQNHYPIFWYSEFRHWTALTAGRFRLCWVLLQRRPKNEDLRPLGLKRRPHGLKRLMLTAEGNARSRNLLRRFGNVVEFPLQYLVVIVKSITYLSFRFLCGKYFACFKPLWKCLRYDILSSIFKK